MKITGKTYLFVKQNEYQGGKFNTYSTTISHKNEDGTYINSSIEVRFTKEFMTPDKEAKMHENECYEMEIVDAWPDTRTYTDKDGKVKHINFIKVADAKVLSVKKIDRQSSGLPF